VDFSNDPQIQAMRELMDRQEAEMAQVRDWRWERLAYPRNGPKNRRQRQVITVRLHPSGWPRNRGRLHQHYCHTFGIATEVMRRYFEFHGDNHEHHPVIWHVKVKVKGSKRLTFGEGGGFYCDAHLPEEFRPDGDHQDAPPPAPREKRPPQLRYFATRDEFTTTGRAKVHLWYRVQRGRDEGQIRPWPPQRTSFGTLRQADVPEALRDRWGTSDPALREFKARYFAECRAIRQAAETAIREHPEEAAALFAELNSACCCCGRALTDEYSVIYGIGPECRAGLPPEVLTRLGDRTARKHARTLREAS
jgi:hypothetical protein